MITRAYFGSRERLCAGLLKARLVTRLSDRLECVCTGQYDCLRAALAIFLLAAASYAELETQVLKSSGLLATHLVIQGWQVLHDSFFSKCLLETITDCSPLLLVVCCQHWVLGVWLGIRAELQSTSRAVGNVRRSVHRRSYCGRPGNNYSRLWCNHWYGTNSNLLAQRLVVCSKPDLPAT